MQACTLRCTPAPLAGDDLVGVGLAANRTHQNRLENPLLLDRGRKLLELFLGIGLARIARVGFQELDRHAALAARALDRGALVADVADQRGKSPAQSRAMFVGHVGFAPGHAAASARSRCTISEASLRYACAPTHFRS